MNTNKQVEIDNDIAVCDISRSIRRGFTFLGVSFVVGALTLGASITGSHDIRVTLFAIAGGIVAVWSVYIALGFAFESIARMKRNREIGSIEQSLSGRLTVSRTGRVSAAENVDSNPIPAKKLV